MESVIVCALNAMTTEQRAQHAALWQQVQAVSAETRELPTGYALRLPADAAHIVAAAEWMTLERLCCPFFQFELRLLPEQAAVWLELTGPAGVKQLLQAELGLG